MNYAKAQDAEGIAKILRGDYSPDPESVAKQVANRLLNKKEGKGVIVTAPRQSGKTT